MTDPEEVLDALKHMGIPFLHKAHAPALTIEDAAPVVREMNATLCKNYFLTTRHKRLYCLLLARPDARLHTADVSRQAGTPRLMFAGETEMREFLHTFPGAVTPLGLLFDRQARVRFLMDEGLLLHDRLAFHPCDNAQTVSMRTEDFLNVFLPETGHDCTFVSMDEQPK